MGVQGEIGRTKDGERAPHGRGWHRGLVIERIHDTISVVLRASTNLEEQKADNMEDAKRLMDDAIAQAMLACRCLSSGALNNASAGSIA